MKRCYSVGLLCAFFGATGCVASVCPAGADACRADARSLEGRYLSADGAELVVVNDGSFNAVTATLTPGAGPAIVVSAAGGASLAYRHGHWAADLGEPADVLSEDGGATTLLEVMADGLALHLHVSIACGSDRLVGIVDRCDDLFCDEEPVSFVREAGPLPCAEGDVLAAVSPAGSSR